MLLRQSPGCSWLIKSDRTFQAVYGDSSRVFGRSGTELAGTSFSDVLTPALRASWIGRVERVFKGQTLCAAGRSVHGGPSYSITLFPVTTAEGTVTFAGGMAHQLAESDLPMRALQALENDRVRLSTLLHDHVGQYLSAAGLQLDLLRMDLADAAFPIAERTGAIQTMLETVMELVRDFNHELNPAVAERLGLCTALDRLAGRLRQDFKGNVRVLADATIHPSPAAAAALYRIAQEATGNAVRHAGCSSVEILLNSWRNGTVLEIRDNGRMVDAAEGALPGRGLGLLVMQYYAEQAGIELEVHGAPDAGTVVRALCPAAGQLRVRD